VDADDVEALTPLALDLDVVAVDGKDPDRRKERQEIRRSLVPFVAYAQPRQYGRRAQQGDPDREPWLVDVDKRCDDEQRDRSERHDPEASTQHATLV
jgi:hypothetical protein